MQNTCPASPQRAYLRGDRHGGHGGRCERKVCPAASDLWIPAGLRCAYSGVSVRRNESVRVSRKRRAERGVSPGALQIPPGPGLGYRASRSVPVSRAEEGEILQCGPLSSPDSSCISATSNIPPAPEPNDVYRHALCPPSRPRPNAPFQLLRTGRWRCAPRGCAH